jgi:hypothetical protein
MAADDRGNEEGCRERENDERLTMDAVVSLGRPEKERRELNLAPELRRPAVKTRGPRRLRRLPARINGAG